MSDTETTLRNPLYYKLRTVSLRLYALTLPAPPEVKHRGRPWNCHFSGGTEETGAKRDLCSQFLLDMFNFSKFFFS